MVWGLIYRCSPDGLAGLVSIRTSYHCELIRRVVVYAFCMQGERTKSVKRVCAKCGVVEWLPHGRISEYCFACRVTRKIAKERELREAKLAIMTPEEKECFLSIERQRKNESSRRRRLLKKLDPEQQVVLADSDPYKRDTCKHYADCRLKAAKKNKLKVCTLDCTLFSAQIEPRCTEEKVWLSSYFNDAV